jgi:hypothetical protein
VESDPHAFLYWPEKNLVVIPVAGSGRDSSGGYLDTGAAVLKLSGRTLSEVGMLSHEDRTGGMPFMPRRVLVIGNELWTVSDGGILVSDLDTLREVTWLAFT